MNLKDNDFQKKIDELVKNSDYFVASPETIVQIQRKGEKVSSVVIPYKKYLDELFQKRREVADDLVLKLPHLDKQIANGSIAFLYEELKECFVLGIPGASITLAILLFDLAAKYRLFEERKKLSPKCRWKSIEKIYLREVIQELRDYGAINDNEEMKLLDFNSKIRNNYLHYNIQKLVKEMVIKQLPSVNFEKGTINIEYDVKASDRPELWFSAKKALDRQSVVDRVSFCIHYVNLLLLRNTVAPKRNREIKIKN